MRELTSRPSRQRLDDHLRQTIADAEAALVKRGRRRDVWQILNVYLSNTFPLFGGDFVLQERVLGPMQPKKAQRGVPTGELKAFTRIRRHTLACKRCAATVARVPEPFRESARVGAAAFCRPELLASYWKEQETTFEFGDFGPVWRAAQVAAVATAALETSDPLELFAAGAFLEHQRFVEIMLRELPREAQATKKSAARRRAAEDRRRRQRGGMARKGRRAPHVELVYRALIFDRQMAERDEDWLRSAPKRRSLSDVLALLEDNEVFEQLLSGDGTPGIRLPIAKLHVDRENRRLDIEAADGKERQLGFNGLANHIARMKKPHP